MLPVIILMVNYNSWEDCIECINSIFSSSYKNFYIVLVDNNSPDSSFEMLKGWMLKKMPNDHEVYYDSPDVSYNPQKRITLIKAEYNGGFAYGNNVFLKKISKDLIIDPLIYLLNPDTIIKSDTLEILVNSIQNLGIKTVVLGSTLRSYYKPEQIISLGCAKVNLLTGTIRQVLSEKEVNEADYIHGGSFLTYLSSFQKVGYFSEEFFLYWEETNWCKKAKMLGFKLLVESKSVVYDKVGGAIGRGYLAEYYYSKNALQYVKSVKKIYVITTLSFNLLRFFKRIFSRELLRAKAILDASIDFSVGK